MYYSEVKISKGYFKLSLFYPHFNLYQIILFSKDYFIGTPYKMYPNIKYPPKNVSAQNESAQNVSPQKVSNHKRYPTTKGIQPQNVSNYKMYPTEKSIVKIFFYH